MANETPERLRKLLAAVNDEAEQLLLRHELYEVSSYGWLDQNPPNPEYVGYAMWVLNPPFEFDWEPLLNGGTVKYEPTERDEVLLRNGEDFLAAMAFARRSFGVALCHAAVARPKSHISENPEFWREYATTLQWLNIASDRLRDYFLMARFGQTKANYAKRYEKNKNRKPK